MSDAGAWADDAILFDFVIERAAWNPQFARRRFDTSSFEKQHFLDVMTLHRFQRHDLSIGGGACAAFSVKVQVALAERTAAVEENRALEHVVQLTNVSRPGI